MAGSLPDALKGLGMDIRIALPFYRTIRDKDVAARSVFRDLSVPVGPDVLTGDVWETETPGGVTVWLFDRPAFFDRPALYGTAAGDYPDNLERFTFLNRAVLEWAMVTGTGPDILHCHDWQTGLIPAYLKTLYRRDPRLGSVASLFTIHNLGYQGLFPPAGLAVSGLPATEFHMEGLEYWGGLSLLKAGLVYADALTTVSPTYSREIQTPEFGLGMDGILRRRSDRLYGILNGADYGVWNPAVDPHIPATYRAESREGKRNCKAALLRETGLDEDLLEAPLCGVVSRLTVQKGFELIVGAVDEIVDKGAGLVILGSGEAKYEAAVAALEARHPTRIALRLGFDEPLAHRIVAGSDILLVPSLYEPCGLTQLHAMKYGTVPVVRATGGLDDTIEAVDPARGTGTGFKFSGNRAADFLAAVTRAMECYQDRSVWERIVGNGMAADFSWTQSALRYLDVYRELTK